MLTFNRPARSITSPRLRQTLAQLTVGLCGALLIAGSALASPKVMKKVPPEFPAAATKKNIKSGSVKARMNIGPDGKVIDVQILEAEPPKVFDRAVTEALMEWRFEGNGEKQTHEVKLVFSSED
jgi:protein TonB